MRNAAAGAAYKARALDAGRLLGVVEVCSPRRIAEVAFAIDADWRRRGQRFAVAPGRDLGRPDAFEVGWVVPPR
jgi:hypothetical protein